ERNHLFISLFCQSYFFFRLENIINEKKKLSFSTVLISRRVCLSVSVLQMDPVQKAVLHHTLGIPPTAKRKHVSCSVCQLRFNSQSQALAHYKGTKHAKKLKALETPKSKLKANPTATPAASSPEPLSSLKATGDAAASDATVASHGEEKLLKTNSPSETQAEQKAEAETETDTETETEEEKARRLLYCSLCKVAVNSASQLDAHNTGTKHKTMLEARSGVGSIKSFPRPGVKSKLASSSKSSTGLQNKTFYCETCDVHVNSETQLKQHISSRRHKDRAAGKPAKPKYSPYSKPQKSQTKQPIKLILGKEPQCRPLTAQILPAHLAAVAAAIGGSFTHRTNHGASPTPNPALFQTQALPAALLRPAPGPVRTSHPQVLFAPY
uniref:C2H2-type domain-containing protein n=1 Tax=Poecilia mexicana TaxID=48701 RepID=A0A3B3Y8F8_9TELE